MRLPQGLRRTANRLFLPSFLLLSACTVDISQPDPSATAVDAEAKTWAVKFQHQSHDFLSPSPTLLNCAFARPLTHFGEN
ncbi:hypothetical protein ACUOFC_62100, partial [Escherichia sp. TWPC-MK]